MPMVCKTYTLYIYIVILKVINNKEQQKIKSLCKVALSAYYTVAGV